MVVVVGFVKDVGETTPNFKVFSAEFSMLNVIDYSKVA